MTTDKHFHEFFHLDQFSIVLLNPLSEVIHNHLHTKLKTFFLKKGVSKTKPGGCWCYKLKAVLGWVRHQWHPGVYGDGCYNSCETVDHLFIHCVKWFITLSTHCVDRWSLTDGFNGFPMVHLSCRSKETCRLATELHWAWHGDNICAYVSFINFFDANFSDPLTIKKSHCETFYSPVQVVLSFAIVFFSSPPSH